MGQPPPIEGSAPSAEPESRTQSVPGGAAPREAPEPRRPPAVSPRGGARLRASREGGEPGFGGAGRRGAGGGAAGLGAERSAAEGGGGRCPWPCRAPGSAAPPSGAMGNTAHKTLAGSGGLRGVPELEAPRAGGRRSAGRCRPRTPAEPLGAGTEPR